MGLGPATFSCDQARALPLASHSFALGICGRDEIAKALPFKANSKGESFWELFSEKSACHCPAGGRKACAQMHNLI